MRLLTLLAFLLSALPLAAQDFPALFRVVGVAADDVLNIRAEPTARAPILGRFAPDARGIEVMATSPDGRWGLVNAGEQAGWSSLRFLAREGGPGWREGARPLVCFGTEPFWRINLFLPTHRAEVFFMGEGGFELVLDTAPLPSTPFPPTLAVPFSGMREGVAVVREGVCSDGMSDRLYGLETQVYWRGQGEGLSGCCRLSD
jgi:hypothetical protein